MNGIHDLNKLKDWRLNKESLLKENENTSYAHVDDKQQTPQEGVDYDEDEGEGHEQHFENHMEYNDPDQVIHKKDQNWEERFETKRQTIGSA